MLIRNAELYGSSKDGPVDVRVEFDHVSEIDSAITRRLGEQEIDARGGALLPGLHDHHLHLFSLAASLESIPCGPPQTNDADELRRAIGNAAEGRGWLRGAGYFESVAGALDRDVLDSLCPRRPLRIQHRSGSMWFLNSAAIDAAGLEEGATPNGVERDATGRVNGRLFRLDDWLRERVPRRSELDLAPVGQLLAASGVTGVTDATPTNGRAESRLFRSAQESGALPQHLYLMGDLELSNETSSEARSVGPYKIMLDEPALPEWESLVERIVEAHSAKRAVAIHTVTRTEIHFALNAIGEAGARRGDRLEHASIAPPEAIAEARRLGLTIVTQPNFVGERGDAYLRDVDPMDCERLYPLRAWLEAGVRLAGGTDAPFGRPDPWRAIRAAIERRTPSGKILGADQTLSPEQSVALFLNAPQNPGGALRRIEVGAAADLCLLDRPWRDAREAVSRDYVMATLQRGRLVWHRDHSSDPEAH